MAAGLKVFDETGPEPCHAGMPQVSSRKRPHLLVLFLAATCCVGLGVFLCRSVGEAWPVRLAVLGVVLLALAGWLVVALEWERKSFGRIILREAGGVFLLFDLKAGKVRLPHPGTEGFQSPVPVAQWEEDIFPADRPRVRQSLLEFSTGQRTGDLWEYRTRQGGGILWWECRVALNRNLLGRNGVVVGFLRNVTQRKHALNRLELTSKAGTDAIWEYDALNGRMWRSEGYHTIFGHTLDSSSSNLDWWFQKVHPDDLPSVQASVRKALSQQLLSSVYCYRFKRGDGSYVWVEDRFTTETDEAGKPVRFYGAMRDISPYRELEERFSRMAEGLKVGIWEWHLPTNALWLNKALPHNFGLEEWPHGPDVSFWLQLIHPEDRTLVANKLGEVMTGVSDYVDFVYRMTWPDGSQHWLENRYISTKGADGRPERINGFVYDITTRMEAETAVRALNRELERKVAERTRALEHSNRELERFAATVAHDLRGPLATIAGFVDLLRGRPSLEADPVASLRLKLIGDSALRMSRLAGDLLELARLEAMTSDCESVDLGRFLGELLDEMAGRVEQTGAVLSLPETWPVVRAHPSLLRVIFSNVLENSLKYAKPGRPPRLAWSWEVAGGRVILYLRDHGIGVPAADRQRIFEAFQRSNGSDRPGAGLGLANVRRAVDLLGGSVRVGDDPGEGAVFVLELPEG